MTAIEIKNLTKRYKDTLAVNNLSLTIGKGELFSLLGVNGAGKTTTIKMLSGLTRPTSGDAVILGKSVVKNPIEVKSSMNVSPQETAVAPNLSVYENLELIAKVYGSKKHDAKKKALEIIDKFGFNGISSKKAKTLSGGWKRRLSIAMGLISEPQILYLDEPTLGLDVLARRELWKMINSLKGKVTIILTTHYLEEAEALSDRIGIMDKGVLKALGTAKELIDKTSAKNFEDAFIALAGNGEVAV
jgi:ABC-2 type transport system ATP-binding protein